MAEGRIHNHALNKAFINQLQGQVNNVIQFKAQRMTKALKEDIIERLKDEIRVFSKKEQNLWNKLGVNATDSKNLPPLRGDADFYNWTNEMKNSTGFFIYLNGVQVSGRNRLSGNSAGANTMIQRLNLGSNYVNSPDENKMYKKRSTQYTTNISLSLITFTTSDHSQFVNNPERKRRKDGQLHQGTGWFDIYKRQLAQLYDEMFLQKNFSVGFDGLYDTMVYRNVQGDKGFANPLRNTLKPDGKGNDKNYDFLVKETTYKRFRTYGTNKWDILDIDIPIKLYLYNEYPFIKRR